MLHEHVLDVGKQIHESADSAPINYGGLTCGMMYGTTSASHFAFASAKSNLDGPSPGLLLEGTLQYQLAERAAASSTAIRHRISHDGALRL